MKRWLWPLAGVLVLGLLAACNGGGDSGATDGGREPSPVETISPPPAPTTAPTPAPTAAPPASGEEEAAPEALEVLQQFLPSFGGGQPLSDLAGLPGLTEGGPLEALLLSQEDVPPGYQKQFAGSLGLDASYQDPTLGPVTMAMSMFADEGQQRGIMSMVMQGEDEAALQEGLGEIEETDFAEFEQAFESYSLLGIKVTNVRQVDASGLGDGGFGFGFTMDFSGLTEELGEAFGAEALSQEAPEFTSMDL